MDGRVLLFSFGTCVLTGVAFGLIPAYRAVSNNVNECLREGGRSTATVSRHRTRNILVVTEIALALVLLICAGLMINTVTRILRTTPGFNPAHLVTAEVRLTGDKYVDAFQADDANLNLFVRRLQSSAGKCWTTSEIYRGRGRRIGRLAPAPRNGATGFPGIYDFGARRVGWYGEAKAHEAVDQFRLFSD